MMAPKIAAEFGSVWAFCANPPFVRLAVDDVLVYPEVVKTGVTAPANFAEMPSEI